MENNRCFHQTINHTYFKKAVQVQLNQILILLCPLRREEGQMIGLDWMSALNNQIWA